MLSFTRRGHRIAVLVCALLGVSAVARAQSAVDGFDPGANGVVWASAMQSDGKILVGGEFTMLGGGDYGTIARYRIGRLNPDGSLDTDFDPGANGVVYTLAVQPDGKILLGGGFTAVGGGAGTTPRSYLARLNSDGTLDAGFNPGANDFVYDLAVQADGKILVGGEFTMLGGGGTGATPRQHIGRLNPDGSLDASFDPGADNSVSALAVQPDGKVLVGGVFTGLGGGTGLTPRSGLGRLNPNGSVDFGFDPGADSSVTAFLVQPDRRIVVGGFFTMLGGGGSGHVSRNRIARLNVDGSLDPSFDPGADSAIIDLAGQPDGSIVVGGGFTTLGGGGTGVNPRYRIGRVRVDGSIDPGFNPGATNVVRTLAVQSDGRIVVGGAFDGLGAGTGTSPRRNVGRLYADGSLDASLNPGANSEIQSMSVQPDGRIVVGGLFTTLGGGGTGTISRNRIGRLRPDGSVDPAFNPGATGPAFALVTQPDGKIVVGGFFTGLGGGTGATPRNYIGRLGADGSVDASFDPGANDEVFALAVQPDGKILLGGNFTMLGGGGTGTTARSRIGRLNADGSLDTGFNPGANGAVAALAVQPDGKILVGGSFTMLGGGGTGTTPRRGIGRLNTDGSIDLSFDPGANGFVANVVRQPDGKIVVAGFFTTLGDGGAGLNTRHNIGRLNADGSIDPGFNPGANGLVNTVALQVDGRILVGGRFTALGGGTGTTPRNHIGRVHADGSLDASFDPGTNDWVNAIAVQADGKVMVGGDFTTLGGGGTGTTTRNYIGRLTNTGAATESLNVVDAGATVRWERSGTGPEVDRVTFESSTDGLSFTPLGQGLRTGGWWELGGQSLPTGQYFYLRARGYYTTGGYSASGSIVESVLLVSPSGATLTLTPSTLQFAGTNVGGTLGPLTGPQEVTVGMVGSQTLAWTAAANQPWVQITNGSGTGPGRFTAAIVNPGNIIGSATQLAATITVTATGAANAPAASVTLTLGPTTTGPFGFFDTPVDGAAGVQGSIAVTGWALDDVEIDRVEIWRDLAPGETTPPYVGPGPGNGKVFIARPLFIEGARPDVEFAYPSYPRASRAGWGYLLLTWGLWAQGNGPVTLYAFAFDREGNFTPLGFKAITVSNATATRPFGAVDTPFYGQTVTGPFWNYGWALTPNPSGTSCVITNGNVWVGIDSGPLVPVNYGDLRPDIAAAFPGFTNGTGAGGAHYVDTMVLGNGVHQIGWLVQDSCGRIDGIGSRFFTVLNSAPPDPPRAVAAGGLSMAADVAGAADQGLPAGAGVRRNLGEVVPIAPAVDGALVVAVAQGERVEVHLPTRAGARYAGAHMLHGETRALPLGSSLDPVSGIFYWQPAAGFLGVYELAFSKGIGLPDLPDLPGRPDRPDRPDLVRVRVVVGPPLRMTIDTPRSGEVVQPFALAGWAIDLASADGAGIDAVHVWAHPVNGRSPIFVGHAIVGGSRPDVAATYGAAFERSAFDQIVNGLPPGTYDLLAYAHRAATNSFAAALAVRVVVR